MVVALILPYWESDWTLAEDAATTFKTSGSKNDLFVIAVGDGTSRKPLSADQVYTYETSSGITRSWNTGLGMARELGVDVAIVGNADTLFGVGSVDALVAALDTVDLAGPVSNRPGWGTLRQRSGSIDRTGVHVLPPHRLEFSSDRRESASVILDEVINGFTMAATMDAWVTGAYDLQNRQYFNPNHPQLENEMELQLRWGLLDRKVGVAYGAYVHHFKGVFDSEDLHYRSCRLSGLPSGR